MLPLQACVTLERLYAALGGYSPRTLTTATYTGSLGLSASCSEGEIVRLARSVELLIIHSVLIEVEQ